MTTRTAIALAALAASITASAQIDPSRVIVKVNGTPIVGKDYYRRMEIQPGMGTPSSSGKFVQLYPGYLTLRWLIEEELIVQLAKSQGVAPTDKEVEDELTARMEANPDQFKSYVQLGFTRDDLKRNVLVDLSEFKIRTKGVTVTDFEVEKYYSDNPQKFTLPKRYVLLIVRVQGEENKKPVDDALSRGDKFADVATKYSIDVTKFDGGKLGTVPESDMTPATRTIIAATRKGNFTQWIEQNGQFARFYVEDSMEPKLLVLDAALKRSIRESLMNDRGAARNNLPAMMQEFRKKAVLEFGNFPFADDVKRYFEIGGG